MSLLTHLSCPLPATCFGTDSTLIKARLRSLGPGIAGALFGAAWWFWIDACAASGVHVPPVQYLPGAVATLAFLMISSVSRPDEDDYRSMSDSSSETKTWLLLAYLVSLGSVIGAVIVLIQGYATKSDVISLWPGVAVLFQTVLILASGIILFLSKGGGGDEGW